VKKLVKNHPVLKYYDINDEVTIQCVFLQGNHKPYDYEVKPNSRVTQNLFKVTSKFLKQNITFALTANTHQQIKI